MDHELMQKLAQELKEAREKSGITIEQINSKTRIDKRYLAAIEAGNFEIMPEVYIRAFIKEYANTVGLDGSQILKNYDKAKKGLDFDEKNDVENEDNDEVKSNSVTKKLHEAAKIDKKNTSIEENKNQKKMIYYASLGISLLVLIFVAYKIILDEPNNQIVTEKPFEQIIEEQNSSESLENQNQINENIESPEKIKNISTSNAKQNSSVKKAQLDNNKSSALNSDLLNLTIVGTNKSWIRVVTDNSDNTEFVLEEGMTKVLSANERFYIHVGNSDGVKLLLNNKDLNFRGAPGKVRKVFVTKDGIEYLRRTPNINGR